VALNVPPDRDLGEVKRLLQRGRDAGWWEYEEGCITEAWRSV